MKLWILDLDQPPPNLAPFNYSECHETTIRTKTRNRGSAKIRRAIDYSSVDDHGDFVFINISVPAEMSMIRAEGQGERTCYETFFISFHVFKFRAIEDQSKIAHWLDWEEAEVSWARLDESHTKVCWTLRYKRLLDPAWYFGPWERYAVRLTAGYLIDNLATPQQAEAR